MADKAVRTLLIEPKMTKCDVAQLQKNKVQMDSSHMGIAVEGESTFIYKPSGLLCALLCDIPEHEQLQIAASEIYRKAAKHKPTRAGALGLPLINNIKRDGTLSTFRSVDRNDPRLEFARDGVMGALDPTRNKAGYARIPKYDVNEIPAALAHARSLDRLYAVNAPEYYRRQLAATLQVDPHWTIRGTAFSTVTVNWCFPTFLHVEAGDFKGGLGVITVQYIGGCPASWLVFPLYGVGVLVKQGQVLLADVGNEFHANTAIAAQGGYGSSSGRLATIYYLRPGLIQCGTAEEEAAKRDALRRK